MQRQQVSSSDISSIGYDPNSNILEIEFLNKRVYQYLNVPEDLFQEIMSASSHGKYFNNFIKDKFNFIQIK